MRVKTEKKRAQIVAVAREVFREMGYAGASMAEISTRLGGSKGTLYNYFTSKEELFIAVMLGTADRHAAALLGELAQAGDMRTSLEFYMYQVMKAFCTPEMINFRRMLAGEAGRSPLGRRVYEQGPAQYIRKFAELFGAQIREGHFRKVDAWTASVHVHALCNGAPVQWVLEGVIERPSDRELAAAAKAAADVILRAYAIPSEASVPRRRDAGAALRGRRAASGVAAKRGVRASER